MTVEFKSGHDQHEAEIESLFTEVFTASEGAGEGALIGALVRGLMATTPDEDLYVFSAVENGALLGCIFLSRLRFDRDDRQVFILSPVAVKTRRQKTGVGQALINHGLDRLRADEIDFVVTYGNPDYYCKTGFRLISEEFAQAPLKLSHPHGWLGQALTDSEPKPLRGTSHCVEALNRPELW